MRSQSTLFTCILATGVVEHPEASWSKPLSSAFQRPTKERANPQNRETKTMHFISGAAETKEATTGETSHHERDKHISNNHSTTRPSALLINYIKPY